MLVIQFTLQMAGKIVLILTTWLVIEHGYFLDNIKRSDFQVELIRQLALYLKRLIWRYRVIFFIQCTAEWKRQFYPPLLQSPLFPYNLAAAELGCSSPQSRDLTACTFMVQLNMFLCPLSFLQIGSWVQRLDIRFDLFGKL